MSKVYRLVVTLILFYTSGYSQKQGNIWYFANNNELAFSSGTAQLNTGGQIPNGTEGTASICDANGTLLFYASPTTIWDKNHNVMPNGSGLMGGLSSTQGVMIIPWPGTDSLFYVFTLDDYQNNLQNGLQYSVVDMCLRDGLGDVIPNKKTIPVIGGTGEKMAATFDANNHDIWLVTRMHFTNEFYSYKITNNGLDQNNPVVTPIGWTSPPGQYNTAIGQMKISLDGSKIAFGAGNQVPNVLQLFDFDNATGIVANVIDLPTSNTGNPYGIAFSPDGSKLYVKGPSPTGLDQYDLSSGVPATIIASQYHVTASSLNETGLQIGNNDTIYVADITGISTINSPNLVGALCDYHLNTFLASTGTTLPSFIDNFDYENGIPVCTIPDPPFTISNVFTPNGDFLNDYFPGNTSGKLDFDLKIFNRWGKIIFEDRGKIKGWNGLTKDGTKISDGTYFYDLTVVYPSSKKEQYHGHLLLMLGEK